MDLQSLHVSQEYNHRTIMLTNVDAIEKQGILLKTTVQIPFDFHDFSIILKRLKCDVK